jgi:hypothetical protein
MVAAYVRRTSSLLTSLLAPRSVVVHYDTRTGRETRRVHIDGMVNAIGVSTDGQRVGLLCTVAGNGDVRSYGPDGRDAQWCHADANTNVFAFSRDGTEALCLFEGDLMCAAAGTYPRRLGHPGLMLDASFGTIRAADHAVAVTSHAITSSLTFAPTFLDVVHAKEPRFTKIQCAGNLCVTADTYWKMSIWNMDTKKRLVAMDSDDTITALAISADGTMGIFGNDSGHIGIGLYQNGVTTKYVPLADVHSRLGPGARSIAALGISDDRGVIMIASRSGVIVLKPVPLAQ